MTAQETVREHVRLIVNAIKKDGAAPADVIAARTGLPRAVVFRRLQNGLWESGKPTFNFCREGKQYGLTARGMTLGDA